jgi:hypothetical protein
MDRPRTLDELKDEIRRRAGKGRPFTRAKPSEIDEGLRKLMRNDPETWARVWCEQGERREADGTGHEAAGRTAEARELGRIPE